MNMPTVLVIGDLLLDRYFHCSPKGISPEAPVPSLAVQRTVDRLGGAGNVVANANALAQALPPSFPPVAVRYAGGLPAALARPALQQGCFHCFPWLEDRPLPIKNRLVSQEPWQQLIRFDEGRDLSPSPDEEDRVVAEIEEGQPWDVVLLSDYNHGAVTRRITRAAIACSKTVIA